MNAAAAAGLGLVVGLIVGALVVWLLRRRPQPEEPTRTAPAQPVRPGPAQPVRPGPAQPVRQGPAQPMDFVGEPVRVPPGVRQLLAVLGSSAVVVGPHDEVLESTTQARTVGIVRGSRIAIAELLELVRTVRQDRVIRSVELELRRAGAGSAAIFLSVRIAPLNDELIVILAEDRTTAVRVEETRRDFVANVSHELKTPIGAVALLSEAVESAAGDPEAVVRFAGRLSIESQRLSDLVGQIIDLSRLQADDPLVGAVPIEIDEVLAQAVDRCRVDAEKRQISLSLAGDEGGLVMGSERQLVAAVGNLVENAIIYSDPGARVAVAAHRAGAEVDDFGEFIEITVSDNGIGIAPAEQDRIFERFYRVDYGRSRASGGTGLGLSIVKHIAAAHGGDVTVWSQLGQGSTFSLRLPAPSRAEDHDARAASMIGERSVPDGTPRKHQPGPKDHRRREVAEPATNTDRTNQPQEIVR